MFICVTNLTHEYISMSWSVGFPLQWNDVVTFEFYSSSVLAVYLVPVVLLKLSHDLLGGAQCVLHPLILPCSICWWGPVKDHSASGRSAPLLSLKAFLDDFFPEMLWTGQLKRLSSGWLASIKSSPSRYWDVTQGQLYHFSSSFPLLTSKLRMIKLVAVFSLF